MYSIQLEPFETLMYNRSKIDATMFYSRPQYSPYFKRVEEQVCMAIGVYVFRHCWRRYEHDSNS